MWEDDALLMHIQEPILKVANWPGVTVEKKEGALKYHKHQFKLVDLPGIYSLTSYTMEEKLTRQFILDSEVDVTSMWRTHRR